MNRYVCVCIAVTVYIAATTGLVGAPSGDGGAEIGMTSEKDVAPAGHTPSDPGRSNIDPDTMVGRESGLLPLPAGQPTYHHYYNMATGKLTDVPPTTRVPSGPMPMEPVKVYSNTPPPTLVFRAFGNEIGDDILTVAIVGCDMSMYRIQVARSILGCSNNGFPCESDNECFGAATCEIRKDPGFSTTVSLFDACPDEGGQQIAGTEATMTFPDDGIHALTIDLTDSAVGIDSAFWIIMTFDKPQAGVSFGGPASIGFTDNKHHVAPPIPCSARLNGAAIYAGYYVEVYCVGEFEREYLAYFNPADPLDISQFMPGTDTWIADDIELVVEDCVLSSFEIATLADGGPWSMTAELRTDCDPDSKIAGTEVEYQGIGNGTLEIARFTFPFVGPDAINLNRRIWVAWRYDTLRAKAILGSEPILGDNQDWFVLRDCELFTFSGNHFAAFAISLSCAGDRPLGACCDLTPLSLGAVEAACTQTPDLACLDSPSLKRWTEGASCDDFNAFDPPCGTVACCVPDPQPQGACVDVLPDECDALSGIAGGLRICEPDSSLCGWFPCLQAGTDCCLTGNINSCADNDCCNRICDLDSWCCEVVWDEVCADEAKLFCERNCVIGSVTWIDPPRGVIDARQPHPPMEDSLGQGFDKFEMDPPGNPNACCWSVCHSDGAVSIENLINLADESQLLIAAKPLRGGNAARVVYERTGQAGVFTFHPGNVNGDDASNPGDLAALAAFLQGDSLLPWGQFGCDIDRSGECGPADMLRLIDLLHGGAAYVPWNDTAWPVLPQECP